MPATSGERGINTYYDSHVPFDTSGAIAGRVGSCCSVRVGPAHGQVGTHKRAGYNVELPGR